MWYGGDVLNQSYLESRGLKRPQSSLTTCTGTFYKDLHASHPLIYGFTSRIFCGELSRERCGLPGSFESLGSRRRLRHNISVNIGNSNDRVVKSGLNVGHSTRYDTSFFLLANNSPSRHSILPVKLLRQHATSWADQFILDREPRLTRRLL